jgi:hypothetical protein
MDRGPAVEVSSGEAGRRLAEGAVAEPEAAEGAAEAALASGALGGDLATVLTQRHRFGEVGADVAD